MKIIPCNKTNLVKFSVCFAIFNLIIISAVPVQAKPTNKAATKAVETKLDFSALTERDSQSLDLHLILSRGIADTSEREVFAVQNDLELAEENPAIPSADRLLIANTFGGRASWYGPKFHGRLTASGEVFNQYAFTAAHPSLRFGTRVKVTNLNNGLSTIVRINDRGPFVKGRVIDLSAAAARSIGLISTGVAPVKVTILN